MGLRRPPTPPPKGVAPAPPPPLSPGGLFGGFTEKSQAGGRGVFQERGGGGLGLYGEFGGGGGAEAPFTVKMSPLFGEFALNRMLSTTLPLTAAHDFHAMNLIASMYRTYLSGTGAVPPPPIAL